MIIYNLTMHKQDFPGVEAEPRLRPVNDPANFRELKEIVAEAVKGLRAGDSVLVGGLGQFQALVMYLPFVFYFADFDPATKKVKRLIQYPGWTRQEIYDMGF